MTANNRKCCVFPLVFAYLCSAQSGWYNRRGEILIFSFFRADVSFKLTASLLPLCSKRKRDWEDVDDTTMNADSDQVIRVARRVWVGNLSFTSSWQDLKV